MNPTRTNDTPHSGGPIEAKDAENIKKIHLIILDDRIVKIMEIVHCKDIDIIYEEYFAWAFVYEKCLREMGDAFCNKSEKQQRDDNSESNFATF